MAHKTLIGGTAYEISGGKTLVNGTAYSIKNGKTLVGGTAYEIAFDKFFDLGTITTSQGNAFIPPGCTFGISEPPFDISLCNALLVNGELYEVIYRYDETTQLQNHEFALRGGEHNKPTESAPYSITISRVIESGNWFAWFYSYVQGTYAVKIGISDNFT